MQVSATMSRQSFIFPDLHAADMTHSKCTVLHQIYLETITAFFWLISNELNLLK
jgi:hypothetical protein